VPLNKFTSLGQKIIDVISKQNTKMFPFVIYFSEEIFAVYFTVIGYFFPG